jgi:hypothetical protein
VIKVHAHRDGHNAKRESDKRVHEERANSDEDVAPHRARLFMYDVSGWVTQPEQADFKNARISELAECNVRELMDDDARKRYQRD